MEILNLKVLKGPNYWSNFRKKLIVLELDLKRYEAIPTDQIEDFPALLTHLIPSLHTHHCSEGQEGGFVKRLQQGTWLGHVIEHVALELQTLAGMDCGFGRTRSTAKKGVYYVVFSYEIEEAGIYAAQAAVQLVSALVHFKSYPFLLRDIQQLKRIFAAKSLGVSTKAILREAKKRNIPYTHLEDDTSLVMLGQGCHRRLISATIGHATSCIGVDITAEKDLTKNMLSAAFIPVPEGKVVKDFNDLRKALKVLGYPVVIKPRDGNHGRGITTHILNQQQAMAAFDVAKTVSKTVIVERFVEGSDYRLLVVNYQLVAAAKRVPAFVVGNGQSTLQQLIDQENQNPQRGEGHENYLTKIVVDEQTLMILASVGLTLESILPAQQILYLKHTANISTGGVPMDVTKHIHPQNKLLAERIARLVNLDICGIDLIAKNIETPILENQGRIIEVNAAPGLRMHMNPQLSHDGSIAQHVMDMLYPNDAPTRIPLIAVTGTNGKTTTVRLIAHLAAQAGHKVGFTTTDGIYINHERVYTGDCSGPSSARAVLQDPLIDFAVLECARGGILRQGLGFNACDISILLNVSEDHLGLEGIETLEDLVRTKSVVVRSTRAEGTAILNADDDLIYELREELSCQIALLSLRDDNPRILAHCANGGLAAYISEGFIVVRRNHDLTKVVKLENIPLTHGGMAQCMIQNLLAALLAGIASQFTLEQIVQSLVSFIPSAQNLPGRMNLFHFDHCKVLIDYAHNTDAFIQLQQYVQKITMGKKVGIIGAPGDRRPHDIKQIGFYAAQMFDQIIIRHDKDGRGKTNEEITCYLMEGIMAVNPNLDVSILSDEKAALLYAIKTAEAGTFITCCFDKVFEAIDLLKNLPKLTKQEEIS
ncbi:MAG: cyanophycin synthetase [Gammaproteobacteria bacterium]